MNELQELFHLPLSDEPYTQFCDLDIYLQAMQINNDDDWWKYIWGNG
jgi:hypothetical protein